MSLPWFQSKGQILQVALAAIIGVIAIIGWWPDMSPWWSAFFYGFFASSVVALVVSLISNRNRMPLAQTGNLAIHRAIYGPTTSSQGGKDETALVRSWIVNGSLSFVVGGDKFGDPFPNQFKQLTVDYSAGGIRRTAIIQQDHWCNLP